MKKLSLVLAVVALTFSVSACAEKGQPVTNSSSKDQSSATSKKLDLSTFKPLEIVPAKKVASIAGGRVVYGEETGLAEAKYSIKLPDGTTEDYLLKFESALGDRHFLLTKEKKKEIQRVSGLWEKAYYLPNAMPDGPAHLYVIRGDLQMRIQAYGEAKKVLVGIAEEAISKVK